ncbi:MAG: XRE family transcriptional regulator [Ruminococcus flavefaciens]|nr:XRE family transcriptional regulator [Ruminococcus flavefaciens]
MWFDRLKAMKEESGLTAEQISKQSGIPKPTLEKLFSGATKDPKLPTIQRLVHFFGHTLDDLDDVPSNAKKAPFYSREAARLADAYENKLDSWGRQAVRELVNTELARCEDETHFLVETAPKEEPKVIPIFHSVSTAGIAAPILGEDYDHYELKPEDPQGAMFAIRLQGDSMEPDFPDGSIVFCNRDPLADGDIGVFSVDGNAVCKQYHREGSMTYLFSLNRKRQDADVFLLPGGDHSLVCQGRVITKKRYQIPGR